MALIMTCSDKYLKDHVDDDYMDHCPSEYGYLDDPDECDGGKIRDICVRCWNRLIIPDSKTYNPIVEAYRLLINHCRHNMTIDFNRVVRYLGEALENHRTVPLIKAYNLIVDFHHHGRTTGLEEVIGYLDEALDDECIYIDKPWPKVNPHLTESMRKANEELQKAYEAIRNFGNTGGKVVDIREENEGVTVVVEPNQSDDIPISNELKKVGIDTPEKLRQAMDTLRMTNAEKLPNAINTLRAGAQILDSGDRTQFESGAVRDMREGKGRCDLMPLEVAARLFNEELFEPDRILDAIRYFQDTMNTGYLYRALIKFCEKQYHGFAPTMLLEVAKHFEDGAKKYGENNWQKGIPVHCYIDSAVRHYLKWLRGDTDEPHDRAFVWNLMCCIWEVDYRPKDEHEFLVKDFNIPKEENVDA